MRSSKMSFNTLVGVVSHCVGVRTFFGRSCKMTEASTMQGCSSAIRVPPNSAVKRPSETNDGLPLPPAPPKASTVHPGKLLELSTTIGLSQYHSYYKNSATSASSSSSEKICSGGNIFTRHRGQLKSGRLRPLGLQSDPQLTSQVCLGVVSVKPRRNSQQQRSLTAPIIRPASRHFNGSLHKSNAMPTRRSFSAVNTYQFTFRSASAMTMTTGNQRYTSVPRPLSKHLLPPVLPIEYNEELELNTQKVDSEDAALNGKDKETVASQSSTAANNDGSAMLALEINTISKEREKVLAAQQSKGTRSLLSKPGKLSHGWTESQPIVPVVGTLPPIADSKKQSKSNQGQHKEAEKNNSLESPSTIDRDRLSLDVDAILST